MSDLSSSRRDEIDLGELFSIIWSHKYFIIIVTCVSIFFAGYRANSLDKEYTATAIFKIEEGGSSFDLSGQLGALASLTGITTSQSSGSVSLIERLMGREFIILANQELSFEDDLYFNNYKANKPKAVNWKVKIKKLLGLDNKPTQMDQNEIIERNVVGNYLNLVVVDKTKTGSIYLSVTHENPKKAAFYANSLMELVKKLIESEDNKAQSKRLSYLSETLADALQDMEATQKNLKDYALENSAAAQENFLSGSLKLDGLRMERKEAYEIFDVLSVLENILEANTLNENTYESLQTSYPIVDDISFRRILGMSETISAWTWPNLETIQAVSITLRDRIKRLDVEISSIENNAKRYASSAEVLAKYKRDAKIAEATYTVLIEQVKSQALAAGFKPDTFKVFEYATAPLKPSYPKQNLILLIGTMCGFALGCLISILNSLRRGVYYTKSSIMADAKSYLIFKTNSFRRISRWSISKIYSQLSQRRIIELDETEIFLANKKLIFILNAGGRATASGTARLLATKSSCSGRKILLCDVTGRSMSDTENKTKQSTTGLSIIEAENGLDVLLGYDRNNTSSFFTSSNFKKNIESFLSSYDQIYISTENRESMAGLIALQPFDPTIILLARLRKTLKTNIRKIVAIQPIGILFND